MNMEHIQFIIIIISSIVGGVLVLCVSVAVILFFLEKSGYLNQTATSRAPLPSFDEQSDYRSNHDQHKIHKNAFHIKTISGNHRTNVSGDHADSNHNPEWSYKDVAKELEERQNSISNGLKVPLQSAIPYEDTGHVNYAFVNEEDETEVKQNPERTIAYDKDIKRVISEKKKEPINVPYVKKEKFLIPKKKDESELLKVLVPSKYVPPKKIEPVEEEKKPARVISMEDFDPHGLIKYREANKKRFKLSFSEDLKVEPLPPKPDRSQSVHYENPKISSKVRKEKMKEEEKRKEEEKKGRGKKVFIHKNASKSSLTPSPVQESIMEIPDNTSPRKLRANLGFIGSLDRILKNTDAKPSPKENAEIDAFLF